MGVRTFLAAERVERRDRDVSEFGMFEIDTGIDHGNRHIGAMGKRVRLRQAKFRKRILRRIALT